MPNDAETKLLTPLARKALEYVRNTRGEATFETFLEDHAPVGALLWRELRDSRASRPVRLVTVDHEGRVVLTSEGEAVLATPP